MAQSPAQLSSDAQALLRFILDRKIVRGGELMRYVGKGTPIELMGPVQELVNQNLVEVTGELTPDGLPFATFGIRPSALEYLRTLVQRP